MRGAVLAGGAARRYGGVPKGLLEVGGRRILDRVVQAVAGATGEPPLLVANDPRASTWRPELRTLPDVRPGCGSLGGLEPLCAVYGPACAPAIERRLAQGELEAIAFHPDVKVGTLPLRQVRECGDPAELFFNINSPEDLEQAEALWRRRG